jgi:hypothetical protein
MVLLMLVQVVQEKNGNRKFCLRHEHVVASILSGVHHGAPGTRTASGT